jgi:hypothetical protein
MSGIGKFPSRRGLGRQVTENPVFVEHYVAEFGSHPISRDGLGLLAYYVNLCVRDFRSYSSPVSLHSTTGPRRLIPSDQSEA